MNQDQKFLLNNLRNMINYIKEETDNKCDKIKKDAESEAQLELTQMVNPEKEKIRNRIVKELEEYKTSMKIQQSQKMNKLRLEKLKVKIDCVNNVFEEAKTTLQERIRSRPEDYKRVLKNLLVQGYIKLLEKNVNIICKKEDVETVNAVLDDAKDEFLDLLHREAKKFKNFDMTVVVDTKYFLPDYLIGGIILTTMKSKIKIDNTLDTRLELLKQTSTPEIRKLLFKNSN